MTAGLVGAESLRFFTTPEWVEEQRPQVRPAVAVGSQTRLPDVELASLDCPTRGILGAGLGETPRRRDKIATSGGAGVLETAFGGPGGGRTQVNSRSSGRK